MGIQITSSALVLRTKLFMSYVLPYFTLFFIFLFLFFIQAIIEEGEIKLKTSDDHLSYVVLAPHLSFIPLYFLLVVCIFFWFSPEIDA